MNYLLLTRITRFVLIIFLAQLAGSCSKQQRLPDIVFYLADDQDVYDYGCYGNDLVFTPGVDRLAEEGMMFTNAFTGQAICAPSRSMIYTGCYPLKNGCFLNHVPTQSTMKSVTHYLKEAGYEIVLAGKSHVGPNKVYSWDKWFKVEEKDGLPRPYLPLEKIGDYFKQEKKPFCMFITSEYPHPPFFETANPDAEKYNWLPFESSQRNSAYYIHRKAGYYKNIEEDAKQLESVLKMVDANLGKNTLFIYAADHGDTGKFGLYDRGLQVPIVVRWPKVIEAGSKSDVLVHFTDILPTFMEISNIPIPSEMDGKSMLSAMKGSTEEIHEYVYGVQTNQNIQQCAVFPSRMIRSKEYKYIRNFNSLEVTERNFGENEAINAFLKMGAEKFSEKPFEELYDIRNDPYELNNLASDPAFIETKKELKIELFKWMESQGDFLLQDGFMPLLKPNKWHLDRQSQHRSIPPELENTLSHEDYVSLHY